MDGQPVLELRARFRDHSDRVAEAEPLAGDEDALPAYSRGGRRGQRADEATRDVAHVDAAAGLRDTREVCKLAIFLKENIQEGVGAEDGGIRTRGAKSRGEGTVEEWRIDYKPLMLAQRMAA